MYKFAWPVRLAKCQFLSNFFFCDLLYRCAPRLSVYYIRWKIMPKTYDFVIYLTGSINFLSFSLFIHCTPLNLITLYKYGNTIKKGNLKTVSDGQQFYQYQQHPPLTSNHKKTPQHMALEIQVLACDRHKNVAELKRLIWSQFSPHLLIVYHSLRILSPPHYLAFS